jgi:hypothetical protein
MEKFGVENALMKPEVRAKSAKSNSIGREFVLPSGDIVHVRGYEDKVIAMLLEQGYAETELVVDDRISEYNIPVFDYINKEANSRRAKYYPDIYIPHKNKIIEVKAQWWWDAKQRPGYENRLTNNLRKWQAVLDAGYEYEVWLFKDDKTLEILRDINNV